MGMRRYVFGVVWSPRISFLHPSGSEIEAEVVKDALIHRIPRFREPNAQSESCGGALSLYVSLSLSSLSLSLSLSISLALSVCLSICLSICLSVCLSVYLSLSVCLFANVLNSFSERQTSHDFAV